MIKRWPYALIGLIVCLPIILVTANISSAVPWSYAVVVSGLLILAKYIYDLRLSARLNKASLAQLSQQLVDVKKNSELLNHQKTEYLAKVSHDLRTPLHGINGVIEMIDKETVSPKIQRYLDQMRLSSDALMTVIAGVIDLSGDDAADVVLKRSPFELLSICENVIRIFVQSAYSKQVDIQLHFDPKLLNVWVNSDPQRLYQVLTNLLGNAFKFTDKGSVSLWVILRANTDKHLDVRFMVVDTGVGIPTAEIKSIFDPYYQVQSHQTAHIKGSGLGLNISQELIGKFGGTLNVSSTVNVGSKFFFDINLMRHYPKNVKELVLSRAPGHTEIILVTDKSTATETLIQLFQYWGIDIVQYETPAAILSLTFQNKPSLLILELNVVDNINVAQDIQAHVAARANYLLVNNFEQDSVDNWQLINKPILPTDLIKLSVRNDILRSLSTTSSFDVNALEQVKRYCQKRSFNVLIVDDIELNQIILHEIVKQLHIHDCHFAANGLEAVEKAMACDFDLILMDLNMPLMSGLDASIKINQYRPASMIMAITATVEDDLQTGSGQPIHSVLRKPLTVDSFAQHLYDTFVQPNVSEQELTVCKSQLGRHALIDNMLLPFNILVMTTDISIGSHLNMLSKIDSETFNIQYTTDLSSISQIIQCQPFHLLILDDEITVHLLLKELQKKRLIVPVVLISEKGDDLEIWPDNISMISSNVTLTTLCHTLCELLITAHQTHPNTQLSKQENENRKL